MMRNSLARARLGVQGLTFIEIMVAVVILSIALLPIFAMVSRGTADTDFSLSQTFAINKATETLNALLDNVPFQSLRAGVPGHIRVDDLTGSAYDDTWAQRIVPTLFPGSAKTDAGWPCQGIIEDMRGIKYLITLRVDDMGAPAVAGAQPEQLQIGEAFPDSPPAEFDNKNELTFSFLRTPKKLSDPNWYEEYNPFKSDSQPPRFEAELSNPGVSQPVENVYLERDYLNPTAIRLTQRMAAEKVQYAVADEFAFCTMKRLVIEVQWNLEPQFFGQPQELRPQTQRVHLITLKADLTR